MRVEKEFGIEITDADAVKMRTVGAMNLFIGGASLRPRAFVAAA